MQWLKLLLFPLSLLSTQQQGCKENIKEKKAMENENNQKTMLHQQLIGTWVESDIDENGSYLRSRPRRGGITEITFLANSTVVEKGPLNCGFGRQYEGTYHLEGENFMNLIATYDKTTKYSGPDKDPEPTEVKQQFSIKDIGENTLLMIKYFEAGREKKMPFIRKEKWETLKSGEHLVKPEQ